MTVSSRNHSLRNYALGFVEREHETVSLIVLSNLYLVYQMDSTWTLGNMMVAVETQQMGVHNYTMMLEAEEVVDGVNMCLWHVLVFLFRAHIVR